MKTSIHSKLMAFAILIVFFSLFTKSASAQISPPFDIVNNLGCDVVVMYEIYVNAPPMGCSPSPCMTSGAIPIPASPNPNVHTITPADFGTCLPACNIKITLMDVGGPITPVSVTPGNVIPFTGVPGCTSSMPSMDCTNSIAHINP